jgi:hypothetical protein
MISDVETISNNLFILNIDDIHVHMTLCLIHYSHCRPAFRHMVTCVIYAYCTVHMCYHVSNIQCIVYTHFDMYVYVLTCVSVCSAVSRTHTP